MVKLKNILSESTDFPNVLKNSIVYKVFYDDEAGGVVLNTEHGNLIIAPSGGANAEVSGIMPESKVKIINVSADEYNTSIFITFNNGQKLEIHDPTGGEPLEMDKYLKEYSFDDGGRLTSNPTSDGMLKVTGLNIEVVLQMLQNVRSGDEQRAIRNTRKKLIEMAKEIREFQKKQQ